MQIECLEGAFQKAVVLNGPFCIDLLAGGTEGGPDPSSLRRGPSSGSRLGGAAAAGGRASTRFAGVSCCPFLGVEQFPQVLPPCSFMCSAASLHMCSATSLLFYVQCYLTPHVQCYLTIVLICSFLMEYGVELIFVLIFYLYISVVRYPFLGGLFSGVLCTF